MVELLYRRFRDAKHSPSKITVLFGVTLALSCLAGVVFTSSSSAPIIQPLTMKLQRYVAAGPVRDSAHPALAFPAIDLFSPSGELVYHAVSIREVLQLIKNGLPTHASRVTFVADTLRDIGFRYPDLQLKPERLLGRYTLIVISAPHCGACATQPLQLSTSEFTRLNVNQIIIDLSH